MTGHAEEFPELVQVAVCPGCGYMGLRHVPGEMFAHRIRGEKTQPVCPESDSVKLHHWER